MRPLLHLIFRRIVREGRLTVEWPSGDRTVYEGAPGPDAAVAIRTQEAVRRLVLHPALAAGETFVNGALVPLGCSIYDVMDVLVLNLRGREERHPVLKRRMSLGMLRRRLDQFNPVARARRNVSHHYDLDGRLYALFLDRDLQYSCGYFPTGAETLDEAQAAKKRHIAAKLLLDRPGLRVLDIGSGWGGMALTLARDHGALVTGVTLSAEQLAVSRARAEAEGLADRARFELADYRDVEGTFDRIVSVGMFEHVGVNHYPAFFAAVRRLLAPDGVALLHAIGRSDGPGSTNPWIAKYIFPGGYTPALSEVMPAVERGGLIVTDIEIWRMHYAETLRHWHARFDASRERIASMYDERFCRMFEFYLSASEIAFRRAGQMVFQLQLARRHAAVPLTRDYMAADTRPAQMSNAHAIGTNL